jgi:two-component system response regulator GlrR
MGSPRRLFLVDDDPGILEWMVMDLQYEGFEVQTADSVPAAITLLTESGWVPDVAVVDLLMQPEDGSQLAYWLREHLPAVRIVIYSAWPEADAVRVLRREMKADAFVAKPGDLHHLLAAIRGEE